MPRHANAVDFWRGFALVSIFVNHIPGIWFEKLTHRNVSISDSAELFVFLAGWSLGLLVGSRREPMTAPRLVIRLGGRALKIYAAQILICSLALAILAATAYLLDNPLLLEWHNAAAVFQDPALAHIGLVLLTHQLGYFDILPLYVVLMLAAPALALIDRFARPLLVPLSLALYFASLTVPFTAPTWPEIAKSNSACAAGATSPVPVTHTSIAPGSTVDVRWGNSADALTWFRARMNSIPPPTSANAMTIITTVRILILTSENISSSFHQVNRVRPERCPGRCQLVDAQKLHESTSTAGASEVAAVIKFDGKSEGRA